jgi:hypothetical protein
VIGSIPIDIRVSPAYRPSTTSPGNLAADLLQIQQTGRSGQPEVADEGGTAGCATLTRLALAQTGKD